MIGGGTTWLFLSSSLKLRVIDSNSMHTCGINKSKDEHITQDPIKVSWVRIHTTLPHEIVKHEDRCLIS